jgi:hypothetical protein
VVVVGDRRVLASKNVTALGVGGACVWRPKRTTLPLRGIPPARSRQRRSWIALDDPAVISTKARSMAADSITFVKAAASRLCWSHV